MLLDLAKNTKRSERLYLAVVKRQSGYFLHGDTNPIRVIREWRTPTGLAVGSK